MLGRILPFLLVAAAATLQAEDPDSRTYHQLEHRSQQFVEALVAGRSRDVYRLFVPAFREEIGFARFDSALEAWYGDRRAVIGRTKVQHIRGLGGNAAAWTVFQDQVGYSYVFQSWLYTNDEWELTWLSNIMDQTFQYGRSDTAEMAEVAGAALRHIVLDGGIDLLRRKPAVTDTILLLDEGLLPVRGDAIEGHTLLILDRAGLCALRSDPPASYFFDLALIRILGDIAICAVDLRPLDPDDPGPLGRKHGVKLYLEREGGGWAFCAAGNVW